MLFDMGSQAAGFGPALRDGRLWLSVVGVFAVGSVDGAIPAAEVGSRKARTLLALLAVEGGRVVPVDRVIEVLWGEVRPRRPVADVATLVSRLRAGLGADVVVGRRGYRLGHSVAVDLYEARALVVDAEARLGGGAVASAMVSARRAVGLLDRGEVLVELPDADWAERARAVRADLLRRGRHAVAEAALCVGDAATARVAADAAVGADPLDERACRALMRAFYLTGEPGRALAAYERLRTVLADELGVAPSEATRDLHTAVLQERVSVAAGRG